MALSSKVYIETALRNCSTILKDSFCNPPFRIANITENKNQLELQLMLMSSSPGVLDNDEYYFEINIAEDSSLQLFTQSYQRLFRMKNGAKQSMNVTVKEGAHFTYLPHPLVPHENSLFVSRNGIHLLPNSSLIWGEVISCGRKLNGEVFRFSLYHGTTSPCLCSKT